MTELMRTVVKAVMGDVRITLALDAQRGVQEQLVYTATVTVGSGRVCKSTYAIALMVAANLQQHDLGGGIKDRLLQGLARELAQEVV